MGVWTRLLGLGKSAYDGANDLGVVTPTSVVEGTQWVDVPVSAPGGGFTTAWSGGVPVLDPGVPLWMATSRAQVERIWRTQPNVRKVVDFIARNVASVPLHVHERLSDDDRPRVSDHPLAQVLAAPQPRRTAYRFWHAIISDRLLYDRWAALKVPQASGPVPIRLVRVPAHRLSFTLDGLDQVTKVRVYRGASPQFPDGWQELEPEEVVFDHGYSPSGAGLSPIDTLADILAESIEAIRWRRQVWANGARIPAWVERPVDGDVEGFDRAKFDAEWRSRFTGTGPDAGGAPLLEDGLKLHKLDVFTPQEMGEIEARTLTGIEVATAFHIAPELVGARQGTYSNVREYRQMLYGPSLGPYIREWEQAVDDQLTPDLAAGRPLYVEANVDAMLRGSFEERAAIMSTAVGGPWLLRNEARALDNRSALDGGDDLIVPLNVIVGGQASPRDSGSQNLGGKTPRPRWLVKSADTVGERMRQAYADDVAAFVGRQQAAVTSALGAKAVPPLADAWDTDRWDRELAVITFRRMNQAATVRAAEVVDALDVEDFDPDELLGWVAVSARKAAAGWNAKTYDALAEAVRESDWKTGVSAVFAAAAVGRAAYLATTTSTDAGNFGAAEVATRAGMTTKTWVVTSANPRSSHAAMNGETVPVGQAFSNGARWPGDAVLPEEERANCQCVVEFNRED